MHRARHFLHKRSSQPSFTAAAAVWSRAVSFGIIRPFTDLEVDYAARSLKLITESVKAQVRVSTFPCWRAKPSSFSVVLHSLTALTMSLAAATDSDVKTKHVRFAATDFDELEEDTLFDQRKESGQGLRSALKPPKRGFRPEVEPRVEVAGGGRWLVTAALCSSFLGLVTERCSANIYKGFLRLGSNTNNWLTETCDSRGRC